jgi:bacillithiol biosynthesis cysteine-adding enzyme BshC
VPANSVNQTSTSDATARIPVDLREFPGIRRLAADYADNFPAVAPFFAGDPSDRHAWEQSIARVHARNHRRRAIAEVVAAQQHRRGAPPLAVEAGRRLADSRTVAIVTGQQAGLFGGPLFTLLKALTAIKLAERVGREFDVPTVAVFWVEGEDHDWDEVRTCTVFDDAGSPTTVSLPAGPMKAAPVASIPLDESIEQTMADIASALPVTEFKEQLVADLRQVYAPGIGMADAFGRWLERVLGPRGLIVYDASDPAGKPLAAPVFARELSTPGQTARLAARAGADLEARGYHSQVQTAADAPALFRLDGSRSAIQLDNGQLVVGDRRYAPADLVREAAERPGLFSPNVLLRPVVQDTLFPTACYVAGPNELGYLGQLRPVYEHFGVPMPLMHPRASVTILDSAAWRFLTKYDMPLASLQPQDDRALNELLKSQIPPAIDEAFNAASQAIEAQMSRLVAAIPALDPTLEGAARSTLGRMQHDLQTLNGKMIQAAKRRDETLRRQFSRTRSMAFPDGRAQERTIGFVSFLNQYGPAFVERLEAELPLDLGKHWILTI